MNRRLEREEASRLMQSPEYIHAYTSALASRPDLRGGKEKECRDVMKKLVCFFSSHKV